MGLHSEESREVADFQTVMNKINDRIEYAISRQQYNAEYEFSSNEMDISSDIQSILEDRDYQTSLNGNILSITIPDELIEREQFKELWESVCYEINQARNHAQYETIYVFSQNDLRLIDSIIEKLTDDFEYNVSKNSQKSITISWR